MVSDSNADLLQLLDSIGQAEKMGMDGEFMKTVLMAIHEESIRQQMLIMK